MTTMLNLPQWWDDQIQASWLRSRDAALSDWSARGLSGSAPSDGSIVEHALAFGHGARSAYPGYVTWEAASLPLRSDWIRLGNTGPASWHRVADIVHHEWRRAAGPGGDAPRQ